MKKRTFNLIFVLITVIITSCFSKKSLMRETNVSRIISIDSIEGYYVLKVYVNNKRNLIVLAERLNVKNCISKKKYIINDSIQTSYSIKSGNKFVLIGPYVNDISGVKIKEKGNLLNVVNSCQAFTDVND